MPRHIHDSFHERFPSVRSNAMQHNTIQKSMVGLLASASAQLTVCRISPIIFSFKQFPNVD